MQVREWIKLILMAFAGFITIPIWIWFTPLIFMSLIIWWLFLRPLPPKHVPLRSIPISNDTRRHAKHVELVQSLHPEARTLDAMFRDSVNRFPNSNCLGYRPELGIKQITKTVEHEGKSVEKSFNVTKKQRAFQWQTYQQVYDEVLLLGSGLASTGLKPGDAVSIYSDTRPEWQKSAQACFVHCFPLVTSYASLGEDALVFSFNQSESTHVITTAKLLKQTVMKALRAKSAPHVRVVVYFDSLPEDELFAFHQELQGRVQLLSYQEVLDLGKANGAPKPATRPPRPEDVAVIMYTSGSTGNPKGVVITHSNLVSAAAGASKMIPNLNNQDIYLAFLPLAHVLELMAETVLLSHGASVGYSNPQQLTDEFVIDENDQPCGDFKALRPTLAAAVPLLMDKMRKAVLDRVSKSTLSKFVFETAYKLKRRLYLAGLPSPILDALVFKKVHAILGGRLRVMLSGGAPLSPVTQEFMNIVFCIPIGQGYGSTETCGSGTITDLSDVTTSTTGPPVPCSLIRLVDVPEMGYLHADRDPKTNERAPRGEVWIGGPNVALGYFHMPEKTAEDFVTDENGIRWFKTGDIGRFNPDGTLSVIDRKKDLVKLAGGEYIALGAIEAKLKSVPLVENVCVYGDSLELAPVAVVMPNRAKLHALATSIGLNGADAEWPTVARNSKVQAAVLSALQEASKTAKLKSFEIVAGVHLAEEEWTPDNKLLTDAMKLKRAEVNRFYAQQLQALYKKKH